MSYLGNTPTQQNFVAGADQFSGTGSQTAFTLSRVVNTVFDIFVTVSNVPQDPFTAYTISGNTLTFDSAPPSGTNNIDVVYRATNVQTFVPSPGVSQQFAIGTAASPAITFVGDTNTGIFSPAADTIAFTEGGAEVARFNSAGNFGIGTSSPVARLDVPAEIRGYGLYTNLTNGTLNLYSGTAFNTGGAAIAIRGSTVGFNNNGMEFYAGGSERMRIDSSGRLGFPGAASTYGAVTIYGQKNGWSGINFNSSAGVNVGTLMMADGFGGFFNTADNAWLGYFSTSGLVLGSATLLNPTGSAPMYTCRAWVNFNGTGTVAIRASGNVSSITDNGTGSYTINFTTAMPDANYAVTGMSSRDNSGAQVGLFVGTTNTTSSCGIIELAQSSFFDVAVVTVAIFR